jgi:hypothetical protein
MVLSAATAKVSAETIPAGEGAIQWRKPDEDTTPEDAPLVAEMEALAKANGRSLVDEVVHARRRHLAQPPTVRVVVEEPKLAPAEIDRPVKKSTKRGSKRKEG